MDMAHLRKSRDKMKCFANLIDITLSYVYHKHILRVNNRLSAFTTHVAKVFWKKKFGQGDKNLKYKFHWGINDNHSTGYKAWMHWN